MYLSPSEALLRYFDPVADKHARYQIIEKTFPLHQREWIAQNTISLGEPAHDSLLELAGAPDPLDAFLGAIYHLDRIIWQMASRDGLRRNKISVKQSQFRSGSPLLCLQRMQVGGEKLEPFVTCQSRKSWAIGIRGKFAGDHQKFRLSWASPDHADPVCRPQDLAHGFTSAPPHIGRNMYARRLLPYLGEKSDARDYSMAYDGNYLMIYKEIATSDTGYELGNAVRTLLHPILVIRGLWQAILYRQNHIDIKQKRFAELVPDNTDLTYSPTMGHTKVEWLDAAFGRAQDNHFSAPVWFQAEDLLCRQQHGEEIRLSEIRFADKTSYHSGQFVTFPNKKAIDSTGAIFVKGEDSPQFVDHEYCRRRDMVENEVEHKDFNERFATYATDEIELHYLLPLSKQEAFLNLFYHVQCPIFATFRKGMTNIFIANSLDFLDPPYEKRTTDDIVRFFRNDLDALIKILDFFKS